LDPILNPAANRIELSLAIGVEALLFALVLLFDSPALLREFFATLANRIVLPLLRVLIQLL
jgi:hypothetical protein